MADPAKTLSAYPSGRGLLKTISGLDEAMRTSITTQTVQLLEEAAGGNKENAHVPSTKTQAASTGLRTPTLATVPDLNLQNPRGKFTMTVHEDSLIFSNAKTELYIPRDGIKDVVILERVPGDNKGRILLLLSLAKDVVVTSGKQQLDAIVIQTTESLNLTIPVVGGETENGPAAVVLCTLLGRMGVQNYVACDPAVFSSSTGSAGVKAVHKVSSGYLFPLPTALCFVEKPALLIPHSSIKWLELARIDRPTATFDLVIHCHSGHTHHKVPLDQLERSELSRLQAYLAAHKIKTSKEEAEAAAARQQQAALAGTGQAGGVDEEEEEDSDDEEDEDFEPEGSSTEGEEEEEEAGPSSGGASADKSRQTKSKRAEAEEEDIGESEDDDEDEEEDEYESTEEDSDDFMVEEDPLPPLDDGDGEGEEGGRPSKRRRGATGR